ncbi:MAG: hypothetical protein Fur0018_24380 [Anaerolineales bacterium]
MAQPPSLQKMEILSPPEEGNQFGAFLNRLPWWFIAIILIALGAAYLIFAKEYLFSTDLTYVETLNNAQVSEDLSAVFAANNIKLSKKATISVVRPDQEWHITDGKSTYIVAATGRQLEIRKYSNYYEAFDFIKPGIRMTISISLTSYGFALVLGLLAGVGRLSKNVVFNNLARLYIEFVRGIPMLVLIFFIAFVGVPTVIDLVNGMGIGNLDIQSISMENRAVIALAVTYGAFLAEIFRAGIQSIGGGQMEAARSLGMTGFQAMRFIILPQAIRNVLPALANDFVAMVKDSSLVSVLAVRDITQTARLYAGSTFRFREAYVTISIMYLTVTVVLSLLVQLLERKMMSGQHR